MNFVFISPNFPSMYSHFVRSLRNKGVNVLGIGDEPYSTLNQELRENLTEYCYVSNMANLDWMKNTLDYLRNKYGHIDYVESNNEFWLENDAELRAYLGINTSTLPEEMEKIKFKSKMKSYFEKAGVKVARYHLVTTLEASEKFVSKVGYPVFAKPDNGVGANATYRINNHEELVNFHNTHPDTTYIMEEFLEGYITSFDGICDSKSKVVVAFNETFPTPIAEVVNNDMDVYYYAKADMDAKFRKMGEKVVSSFGIRKRCFHIEFFVLTKDRPGLGKKGDIIALEVNMRSPGGYTPDLLATALDASYYDIYADVIVNDSTTVDLNRDHYIAISVARKDRFHYVHSTEEVFAKYTDAIRLHDYYPDGIAKAMGKEFFFGRFKKLEDAMEFQKFIHEKY